MIVLNILWNFKVVKKVICQDKGVMFWFLGGFFCQVIFIIEYMLFGFLKQFFKKIKKNNKIFQFKVNNYLYLIGVI